MPPRKLAVAYVAMSRSLNEVSDQELTTPLPSAMVFKAAVFDRSYSVNYTSFDPHDPQDPRAPSGLSTTTTKASSPTPPAKPED